MRSCSELLWVGMAASIITRAAEFCSSPKFERVFDNFARDHADVFNDATEAKSGDVEHKHEYKELHDQYLKLFEEELSDFVESEGATIEEFFKECREIHDGQYTALFEEHTYAWFVDHLLACMDYKHFYGLMVNEARRLHHLEALHAGEALVVMEKRLYVWGSGGTGQLGVGTEDDYDLPQRWDNAKQLELESITSGGCHSAGIREDGRLFLWGADDRSQLGRSMSEQTQNFQNAPTEPVTLYNKTKLVACGWWHTVAVVSDDSTGDRVFSWGSNDHLQLGREQSSGRDEVEETTLVVQLPPRLQVAGIACGWKHSLLATADGQVFSWGSGRHGQLGLGNDILKAESPKCIDGVNGMAIRDVFCGWEHSVFRSSSGEVFTCGHNRHGQLGVQTAASGADGASSEKSKQVVALPIRVADPRHKNLGLRTVQVGCGWHFVLCLTEDGNLVAWGKGSHGQLGLGGFENASEPQLVTFAHTARQIACGSEHSMVVTTGGELYTCGWGEHGNLGHGDKTNRPSLEKVDFFVDASQELLKVAAGGAVSIAVTRNRHQ